MLAFTSSAASTVGHTPSPPLLYQRSTTADQSRRAMHTNEFPLYFARLGVKSTVFNPHFPHPSAGQRFAVQFHSQIEMFRSARHAAEQLSAGKSCRWRARSRRFWKIHGLPIAPRAIQTISTPVLLQHSHGILGGEKRHRCRESCDPDSVASSQRETASVPCRDIFVRTVRPCTRTAAVLIDQMNSISSSNQSCAAAVSVITPSQADGHHGKPCHVRHVKMSLARGRSINMWAAPRFVFNFSLPDRRKFRSTAS